MARIRITSTGNDTLRMLGTPGLRSHALIVTTVREHLGPAHAGLFAEPVQSADGTRTEWFVDAARRPQPIASLTPEQQQDLRDRADAMRADIVALAATMDNDKNGGQAKLSEALRNAVTVADEDALFAIPDPEDGTLRPVLVNWARTADTGGPSTGMLRGSAPRRPVPSASPAADTAGTANEGVEARIREVPVILGILPSWIWVLWWLLWAAIAAVTFLILFVLIAPCALSVPGLDNRCPVEFVEDPGDRDNRRAQIEDRIAALQVAIARAQAACTPVPPPPPPPPPEEPEPEPEAAAPPQDDIDERMRRENAQRGDLTITLAWDDVSDLDLHVTCPAGATIAWNDRSPAGCGGRLDVDANASSNNTTRRPVENIFFAEPVPGRYRIEVRLFTNRPARGTRAFTLRIAIGEDVRDLRGSVSNANTIWTHDFVYEGN